MLKLPVLLANETGLEQVPPVPLVLNVAVTLRAAVMDNVQALAEVGEEHRGIRGADGTETQCLSKIATLDELHDEELAARRRILARVVQTHEGAVRDAREQRGLGLAAFGVVDALRRLGEDLDGDRATERQVDATIDGRHAAAADEAVEAIAPVECGAHERVAGHAVGGRGHDSTVTPLHGKVPVGSTG